MSPFIGNHIHVTELDNTLIKIKNGSIEQDLLQKSLS
jgi:hypothetical protein